MRYAAYHELGEEPNIVVDGYGTASTVMTLSHWPGSATPDALRDDLQPTLSSKTQSTLSPDAFVARVSAFLI